MRKRAFRLGCLLACLAIAGPGLAQEGHPLTGTWSGDWGPNVADRSHLTLVLEFDGNDISGLINPGPNSANLSAIALDVTDWTVRIEATGPDGESITAEGQLENIESYHRTLLGTWRQGTTEGDFTLTRD
jgi:hypothetical protein